MKKCVCIVLLVGVILSIAGCGSGKKEQQEQKELPVVHVMDEADENTMPIEMTLVNICGVDVGMFSMIDPVTKEQVNVSGIANGESITVGANWPKDETTLQWALYNKDGELCIEASSDITGITESATVVISGDGDVEKVDVDVK